ncbi:MAG: Tad domain-containing protein [Chloroflexi bacterium]|nr:Tad domain-containing protein [Chloroflexota bacterium]
MRSSTRHDGQRGQILAIFALALVAIVAGVGLVIDGGFTFAQRRAEQNAADLASLAGANALLSGKDATAAAKAAAATNGYPDGAGGVTVNVNVTPTTVQVDIGAPHQNYFAGVVGQGSWPVNVTATALAGIPTGFIGVAPFILSQEVFDPTTGLPFIDFTVAYDFTKTQGSGSDAPITLSNMAWTNLGTGNVSADDVKDALNGTAPINASLTLNDYIGQHDNGVQNTLFDTNSPQQPSVNTTLGGLDVAVPIVGDPIPGQTTCNDGSYTVGCFRGWALFHVISASKNGGGEDGTIRGYFLTGITRSASASSVCAVNDPACEGLFHGVYVIKLIN